MATSQAASAELLGRPADQVDRRSPVLTVGGAAALIGRSYPQANAAIERLVSVGLLSQITVGRRNRAFEATAIINAFTDLERPARKPRRRNPDFWTCPPCTAPETEHLIKVYGTNLNKNHPC